MNKYDVEVARMSARAEGFKQMSSMVKAVLQCIMVLGGLFLICNAVIIVAQSAGDKLNVDFLAEFKVDFLVSISATIFCAFNWRRQVKINESLKSALGEARLKIEENDEYRSSSGLNEKGEKDKARRAR